MTGVAGANTTATTAVGAAGGVPAAGDAAPIEPTRWASVCRVVDLEPERGAAALIDGEQLALVRLLDDRVLAVQQLDPFSGAHVVSRGIVGSRLVEGRVRPTIASPMYKQVFDLETGTCLDPVGGVPVTGGSADLRTWPVRVLDGVVQVGVVEVGVAEPSGAELAADEGAGVLALAGPDVEPSGAASGGGP